jgi:hypothetical protein
VLRASPRRNPPSNERDDPALPLDNTPGA